MTDLPLTVDRLRSVLRYDPETGIFIWLAKVTGKIRIGARAGKIGKKGHRVISVDGKTYRSGRLAWLYMTGEMPQKLVDHWNCDRVDDRWENLRQATHSQNARNSRAKSKNPEHLKGAFFKKDTGRWFSSIRAGGKPIHLGTFNSREEAHAAYREAAGRLHGEFARAA